MFLASFVFSFRDFCPRGLSALRAASFSGSSARFHVVWDSSLRRRSLPCRASSCRGSTAKHSGHFGLRVDYESDPRGSAYRLPPARLLTSHATRAAGTRPSSACVEPLRRPLAVTAGLVDTSASESSCLHRGGHPTERVGSVVWGCTPDPVDLSSPRWSPPLQRSAASALPEGSHMPRAEENSHWNFFVPE